MRGALLVGRSSPVAVVVAPLRMTLVPEVSSLPTVRRTLRPWLAIVGAEQADEIVLAVHEAVANAVEHAGLDADEVITIEAEVVDDILRVLVRDNGAWKDRPVDETRGRGLMIMRAVMDRVDLERRTEGTRIKMSRRVRSDHAGAATGLSAPHPTSP
jgi:anti-sigma regulatory factor (Ser/Thr protein kinase)